jgi:hypothetical protein
MEIAMADHKDEDYLSYATHRLKLAVDSSKTLEEASVHNAAAQVRAIQALAVALDRLARAVEQLQR